MIMWGPRNIAVYRTISGDYSIESRRQYNGKIGMVIFRGHGHSTNPKSAVQLLLCRPFTSWTSFKNNQLYASYRIHLG